MEYDFAMRYCNVFVLVLVGVRDWFIIELNEMWFCDKVLLCICKRLGREVMDY